MSRTFGTLISILILMAGCGAPGPDRPNIVLITVDTLRWDYLNAYGYPEAGTTPASDYLAANGMVFDAAVSTMGTTIPSHGSMLTGRYARQHGARSNFHGLYPDVPTIAGALREAGYQTAAFVSNIAMLYVGQLGRDFETTNLPASGGTDTVYLLPGDMTVQQASDWLGGLDGGSPFFAWLHLWEPHGPYDINEWSRDRLGDYGGFLREGVSLDHIRNQVREIVDSREHLEAMRTLYAGEVNKADRHLGEFLEFLRTRGLLKNTIVIFTADHGQTLGEDGRMGHGPNHRETVLRVPMIVSDFRTGSTGRYDTRVSTIDIAPTIADAARLEQRFDMEGRSLLNPEALKPDHPYFAEVALRTEKDRNWQRVKDSRKYDPHALAVYAGPFKMVYRHDEYRLFETAYELKVARQLKRREEKIIADYLQGLLETFQQSALDMSGGEASEESVEQLKSLGYTQ